MPDLTIPLTTPQVARISNAVGQINNLNRPATADEVRDKVIEFLKQVVWSVEGQEAARTAREGVPELDIV